jgi:hypothetical protein
MHEALSSNPSAAKKKKKKKERNIKRVGSIRSDHQCANSDFTPHQLVVYITFLCPGALICKMDVITVSLSKGYGED